jgi:hypothetical protein
MFWAFSALLMILLSTLSPYVNSQTYVTGWPPESAWDLVANKTVWLKISIGGTVITTDYLEIMMFPELMPKAVENFVTLCKGTADCKSK